MPLDIITVITRYLSKKMILLLTNSFIQVGGSLAGLMTSIALRRLGHNVRILERAPTPLLHDQGAGIVAGGEIPTFMSKYDRTKTPLSVTSGQRIYLDRAGRVMQREDKEQRMTSWDLIYHVCRVNFDMHETAYTRGKLEQLFDEGKAIYQHGCKVIGLEEADGNRVKVLYNSTLPDDEDDGHAREVTGDFVIVADGSSSAIRKQLCPDAPERTYAGKSSPLFSGPMVSELLAYRLRKAPGYIGRYHTDCHRLQDMWRFVEQYLSLNYLKKQHLY
jgi:flavin-dependent dehydrogenase